MGKNQIAAVGIDFDTQSIRAVRISGTLASNGFVLADAAVAELKGEFTKDDALVEGLKKIRGKVSPSANDDISTCLSGKQIYANRLKFAKLAPAEMNNALKLELRKSVPFDLNGASIDYQFISSDSKEEEKQDLLVVAVASAIIKNHLRVMEKAHLKPTIVDALPVVVANSFWLNRFGTDAGVSSVMIHFGPTMSTLVIDAPSCSFFHRTIPFSAYEVFDKEGEDAMSPEEQKERFDNLGEEIVKSLSYHEKNNPGVVYGGIEIMGSYADKEQLLNLVSERTNLKVERHDLATRLNLTASLEPGKFDVALALAVRKG